MWRLFLQRCERERERDTVAVIDGEGKTSFQARKGSMELQRRVEALAARIPHATVMPQRAQRNLGVCFERTSVSAVVALLSAIRQQRPCVPLPARLGDCVGLGRERLKDLMGLAKLGAVLCSQQTFMQVLNSWPGRREDVLDVENTPDTPVPVPHHAPDHVEEVPWCSTEPGLPRLYVIFTSGSTGRPKGVEGLESGCLNRLWWQWRCFPWAPGEVCCAHTALSFVDHVAELFGALLAPADGPADRPGPTVVGSAGMEVPQTLRCLKEHQVTRLVITPTLLKAWLLEAENLSFDPWRSLRMVSCSGEVFPRHLLKQLEQVLPSSCRVLNIYGSTEVSGDATCAELPEDDQAAARWWSPELPCGREIHGVQVEVLHVKEAGEELEVQQCGDGEEGEVFVSGACVSSGYFEDPVGTAAAFGVRGFRSGDLGRWERSQRCNQLVKLRGQRVELNSVQLALTSLELAQLAQLAAPSPEGSSCRPIFRDACCVVHQSALVAAVVFSGQWEGCRDLNAVRSALAELLPACAVPAHLLALPTLPTLTSGKVDRCAVLREVEASGRGHPEVVEALDVVEALVQSAWREALQTLPEVDATRSFTQAGGDSARLMQLASQLRRRWPREAAEPPPYDAVLEAAEKSRAALVELCQRWRKRKRESVDEPFPCSPWQGMEPTAPVAAPAAPAPAAVLQKGGLLEGGDLDLRRWCLSWRADLHQCVDAPPLLVLASTKTPPVWWLLIGSHSQELGCFVADTGEERWRLRLSDRIEGGCTVGSTGRGRHRVFVGCYDGQLHCFDLEFGNLLWSSFVAHQDEDREIKHAPALLGARTVLVGTHGGRLTALDAEDGARQWSLTMPGAVFAAPVVEGWSLYVATTSGQSLTKFRCPSDLSAPPRAWARRLSAPLFATPVVLSGAGALLVASVDGVVRKLAESDGSERWSVQLDGHTFAAPCVSGPCAAIGTHGGSVFGLSLHRGDVLWKAQLGDVVYGTPFALGSSTFCVVTRKGRLCFLEGQEVWEAAQLEGEVFSSPVAWNATENTATGTEKIHNLPALPEERICVWFQKGKCKNGTKCQFMHVRQERDGNVVVVRNLAKSTDPEVLETELLQHFKTYGYVTRIQVKTDLNNRCRGFAFVVFADANSALEALKCPHPFWNIKLKSDLPMYIEGETRPSRKTHSQDRVSSPARLAFTRNQTVLLIGEGDFSFAAASVAMGCLDPSNTLATSVEPPRCTKHLEYLYAKGMECRTDVDATSLTFTESYDVVVFNFPHTGEPSIEANVTLLKRFFRSAVDLLLPGGIVAVSLKQTWPYSEWNLEGCAAMAGLQKGAAYLFPAETLLRHGYTHTTTDDIPHEVEHLEGAKTVEFIRAKD
ncbi:unnamed protein product [Durusdinium trenchii]|uniref:Uncharacterized protein n=1 Tax=Durusdinium trenchii TaxID=1381693 RepID=A0ABP0NRY6_9DINO